MDNSNKSKKLFVISKSIEEATVLDLKEFFGDPNKYLESKSKFIVGNKFFFNHKSPLSLNKKRKSLSLNELIERRKKENNDDSNNEKSSKMSKFSLNKIKKYYKQKSKEKYSSSFIPKEETYNKKIYKDLKNKKNILYRNKLSFNNNDNDKSNTNLENNLSFKQKDIHYEYKTKNEILDLFKNFIKREKENGKENKIIRPLSSQKPTFPPKRKLSFKEIKNSNDDEKKNFDIFSKFLSRKCDRDKKNLLVNRIDDFNIKKYMSNYLQENKLFSERLGNKYWICNLRRGKAKNEHKINYVITGKPDKEPWEQIVDSGFLEPEYINNPSIPQNKMRGNNTINEFKIFQQKFPFLNSFNNLKIEGKNLLEKELTNFSINSSKNQNVKYRLYKDPRELKNKCVKDMIYKQNYISPSKSKTIFQMKNGKNKI